MSAGRGLPTHLRKVTLSSVRNAGVYQPTPPGCFVSLLISIIVAIDNNPARGYG